MSFRHSIIARRVRTIYLSLFAITVLLLLVPAAAELPAPSFRDGHLWRVSKRGIDDSFVFGTIHLADPRVSAMPQEVNDALAQTRTLATELLLGTFDEGQVLELEALAENQRLESLIGPETFAALRDRLAPQQLPLDVIARLKPWSAMLKVTRLPIVGGEQSLDERIVAIARARRMRVWSLETLEEQVASFDTVPLETQVALLEHAVAHPEAIAATIEPTISAWLRGDGATLSRIATHGNDAFPGMDRHYRELTRRVVRDRTALMHYRLFMPMREGRVFVAVGAMHLYGEEGLLALLAQDGYRVTRIE